jgi:hypothetical protein
MLPVVRAALDPASAFQPGKAEPILFGGPSQGARNAQGREPSKGDDAIRQLEPRARELAAMAKTETQPGAASARKARPDEVRIITTKEPIRHV